MTTHWKRQQIPLLLTISMLLVACQATTPPTAVPAAPTSAPAAASPSSPPTAAAAAPTAAAPTIAPTAAEQPTTAPAAQTQELLVPIWGKLPYLIGSRGTDGKPTDKYWQNTSHHTMSISVAPPDRTIRATEVITYS